jgi:hypothetical protein
MKSKNSMQQQDDEEQVASIHFLDIPNELFVHIFSYLHYSYIISDMSIINKHFHQLICGGRDNNSTEEAFIDAQKLWKAVCEHQFIPLHSEDEQIVDLIVEMFPKLKIDSVEINVLDKDVAVRYLEALAPYIDYLEYCGPYDIDISVDFPQLSQLHLSETNGMEDRIMELFCSGDKSRFTAIRLNDVSQVRGFSRLERIETVTASSSVDFGKLISENKDTLKKLEYTDDVDIDIDATPIVEPILQCTHLEILRLGDLYIPYNDMISRDSITLENLTELNIRVSTTFIEKFFSTEHPKLKVVILGIQEFEENNLSCLQLKTIPSFILYLWNEPSSWDTIGQLLKCINPVMDNFGLYSEFPVPVEYVKHLTHVKELVLMGVGIISLITPLVRQTSQTLEVLEMKYVDDFDVSTLKSASNLKVLRLIDSTVLTSDVNDISFVIHNHPNLKELAVCDFSLSKTSLALKIIDPKNIHILELKQDKSKSTDLFYLLPSHIEEVRVSLGSDATIDEWILVLLCCHQAQKVELYYDDFPILQLMSKTTVLSFSADFVKRLKKRIMSQLNSSNLIMSNEERETLRKDYEKLFHSERTFSQLLERHPAMTTLYRCACSAFSNIFKSKTSS